jgi:hypothetical protein
MGIIEYEHMRRCGRDMAQIIEHCYKAREASVRGVCYVGSEQVCGSAQVAEHHMPWPQRWGFTVASAPANGAADPMALGPQRHLLGKPGLADAGRPADRHYLPMAPSSDVQELH